MQAAERWSTQEMICERVQDEYGLSQVQIEQLSSVEGEPLRCSDKDALQQLVREVGMTVAAVVRHPDKVELCV